MWISIPGGISSASDRAFSSAPKITKKARMRSSKSDLRFSAVDRRRSCGSPSTRWTGRAAASEKSDERLWGNPWRDELADWNEVMAEQDVRENQITKTSVQELRLILLKQAGDIFAYRDECPHEQHPLSLGELDEGVLICAKHLWEFEIRTGQHITHVPRVERNLVRYPVRIVNG